MQPVYPHRVTIKLHLDIIFYTLLGLYFHSVENFFIFPPLTLGENFKTKSGCRWC